jgi:RNA polymerase sigma-70 factor, ECF subfamily
MTFAIPNSIWYAPVKMRAMTERQEALEVTSSLTDAELIARLAFGDESAFAELYDRYSNAVFGLAKRVTQSEARAEEITQDAFMKLWRNPGAFDASRAALSTYLLTLVRNASIDALRRERPTNSLLDDEGDPLPIPSPDSGPLERAELQQTTVRVRRAMLELSDAHRQTVELAYFRGASREEISAQMGVPVGTVKSRLKYALDKLRTVLGELGDLPASDPPMKEGLS